MNKALLLSLVLFLCQCTPEPNKQKDISEEIYEDPIEISVPKPTCVRQEWFYLKF
jgi:hypothetical protein